MIELPASQFTFGNYNAEIPYKIYEDNAKLLEWLQNHNLVGYTKVPVWKGWNTEGYTAVLIEVDEKNDRWNHIPNEVFEQL